MKVNLLSFPGFDFQQEYTIFEQISFNSVMSLRFIISLIFICTALYGQSQLVTKKDYTASFALQAGAESGIIATVKTSGLKINPTAGLKMTFPFNRKWFLGSEINYSMLKTRNTYRAFPIELDLKQIIIPLYVKYMLRSNRATVLLGGYAGYLFDNNHSKISNPTESTTGGEIILPLKKWDYGFTAGYEQHFTQRLNLTFKVCYGIHSLLETSFTDHKFSPLRGSLTLSYDLFRIGDCGCH